MSALDAPYGGVDGSVAAFESDFGGAEGASSAEEVARVGLADLLFCVVEFCVPFAGAETRGPVVEGEAEGVEEGGFTGSGWAGDGEESGGGEGRGGEVDGVASFEGREIFDGDAPDFHA